jgi:hypothetical protein
VFDPRCRWAPTDDNHPPGLPGRVAALAARLPGGLAAVLKPLHRDPRLPDLDSH